jgi:hypothetical protein
MISKSDLDWTCLVLPDHLILQDQCRQHGSVVCVRLAFQIFHILSFASHTLGMMVINLHHHLYGSTDQQIGFSIVDMVVVQWLESYMLGRNCVVVAISRKAALISTPVSSTRDSNMDAPDHGRSRKARRWHPLYRHRRGI